MPLQDLRIKAGSLRQGKQGRLYKTILYPGRNLAEGGGVYQGEYLELFDVLWAVRWRDSLDLGIGQSIAITAS